MSYLDSLKTFTTVVSDSGDFESIDAYKPQDATTNPSLILAAVKQEKYARLIDVAVKYAKEHESDKAKQLDLACDRLLVEFGAAILALIPGRVSTEVDAKLSFDKEATKAKAKELLKLYKEKNISQDRVLIKIASTFNGIQAARELESEGIHTNLTLLFGFGQAVACAEAKVTLISPFVGRILDYFKKVEGKESYPGPEDPGVKSVTKIYHYYKQNKIDTIVMGASFRNIDEIVELAGCDYLTIAPALLEELKNKQGSLERKLSPETAKAAETIPKVSYIDDEAAFQWELFNDEMAFTKLHEGIRSFDKANKDLRALVEKKL